MNELIKNFQKNNYVVIDNYISLEILKSHYEYFIDMYKENKLSIDENQVIGNLILRDDIVFDTLLSKMRPLISKITQKELWPTYAFARLYRKGEKLKKHTDREACEYSVSITLGCNNNNKIWPIFVGDKVKVKLKLGQGLLYKGHDLNHWRKKLKGDHYAQVFLHYVDSNGPYKEWVFDKRSGLNSLDYEINSL
jgi:hypothetical protein